MSNENLQPTVGQMLRMTGGNTQDFMNKVADHVEQLEAQVGQLKQRIAELEQSSQPE